MRIEKYDVGNGAVESCQSRSKKRLVWDEAARHDSFVPNVCGRRAKAVGRKGWSGMKWRGIFPRCYLSFRSFTVTNIATAKMMNNPMLPTNKAKVSSCKST